ncbi:Uncharacterised protein [Mycobacteroides abscessus subsp. abscessus]|nr:Uncharacterised protein [Mycobacteroides abscessus subsp. abscessus]
MELSVCWAGEVSSVMTGSRAMACFFPSSTPHWSKESMPQTVPAVNTWCS